MTSTKKLSHRQVDASTKRQEIYDYLIKNPSLTRAELALGLATKLSGVCGRVNELLKEGLIHVGGRKTDFETGRSVEFLNVSINMQ